MCKMSWTARYVELHISLIDLGHSQSFSILPCTYKHFSLLISGKYTRCIYNTDIYLYQLSKFLRLRLMIFIIQGFQTIVFMFVIFTMFWSICPLAFFKCLSNSGVCMEIWTRSFIQSMGVTCSDSVNHNRVLYCYSPAVRIEPAMLAQSWLQATYTIQEYLYSVMVNRIRISNLPPTTTTWIK